MPKLPGDHLTRYVEYDKMGDDPIYGRALRLHAENALTYDEESGTSIFIESRDNENDPVVADLRAVFSEWLLENAKKIAYNAAKYGCWGVRLIFSLTTPETTGEWT